MTTMIIGQIVQSGLMGVKDSSACKFLNFAANFGYSICNREYAILSRAVPIFCVLKEYRCLTLSCLPCWSG